MKHGRNADKLKYPTFLGAPGGANLPGLPLKKTMVKINYL